VYEVARSQVPILSKEGQRAGEGQKKFDYKTRSVWEFKRRKKRYACHGKKKSKKKKRKAGQRTPLLGTRTGKGRPLKGKQNKGGGDFTGVGGVLEFRSGPLGREKCKRGGGKRVKHGRDGGESIERSRW